MPALKLVALQKFKVSGGGQTANFTRDRKAAEETTDVDDGPDWRPEQILNFPEPKKDLNL